MPSERLINIRKAKQRFYDLQSDLLSSSYHNFSTHFDGFVDFCESDTIMAEIIEPLKQEQSINVKEWFQKIVDSRGSAYNIPSDPDKQASLLYDFILGIRNDEYDFRTIMFDIYNKTRYDEGIYAFNDDIIKKLVRTLNRKLEAIEQEEVSHSATKVRKNNATISDPSAVFVVHGRNEGAREAMFTFLRALGLNPIEWNHAIQLTGEASPYIGQVLDAAFNHAQAIVVLMTPDDQARLRDKFWKDTDGSSEKEYYFQPRQNVLFEAGMAIGRDEKRTIIVELGRLRRFSDIMGRHSIRIDNSPERRNDLAQRLENAGCLVNRVGSDWLSAGDFEKAIEE